MKLHHHQSLVILILTLLSSFQLAAQQNKINYGQTAPQIEILNMDCLHQRGFTGKGRKPEARGDLPREKLTIGSGIENRFRFYS